MTDYVHRAGVGIELRLFQHSHRFMFVQHMNFGLRLTGKGSLKWVLVVVGTGGSVRKRATGNYKYPAFC